MRRLLPLSVVLISACATPPPARVAHYTPDVVLSEKCSPTVDYIEGLDRTSEQFLFCKYDPKTDTLACHPSIFFDH
jgi:hypothetical protein